MHRPVRITASHLGRRSRSLQSAAPSHTTTQHHACSSSSSELELATFIQQSSYGWLMRLIMSVPVASAARGSPLQLQTIIASSTMTAHTAATAAAKPCMTRLLPTTSPLSLLPLLLLSNQQAVASATMNLLRCAAAATTGTTDISRSSLLTSRRFASSSRRPTYQEITEALAVLNVSIDEDPKAFKKKYRELVKKNHPDAGGDEKLMAHITVAYNRLADLSDREKEEYKTQSKMYRGGYSASSQARYRPAPGFGTGAGDPFGTYTRAQNANSQYYQGADPYAQARAQQQAYQNFYNRTGQQPGAFSQSPFSTGPFTMGGFASRARAMPSTALLVQGLIAYLLLSALFLFLYRKYRDWGHTDGWKMSESLARHAQMEEIHRIRQEMNERAMQMRQSGSMYGGGDDGRYGFGGSGILSRNMHVGESAEMRALEYARQRRMQDQQQMRQNELAELRGWPRITEEQGRIARRAQDPPGIVFFEPRKEDARRRQIENHRKTAGSVMNREQDTTKSAASPPQQQDRGTAASNVPLMGIPGQTHGSDPAHPLPPEQNVGSVFVSAVNNDADARDVMRTLLGVIKEARKATAGDGK